MSNEFFLDNQYMNDLIFLCAHDFKHDFVEDKERSGRAFGAYPGYAAGGKEAPSNKIIEEPENFPLICYAYLICKKYNFDFDKLCNELGRFGKQILDDRAEDSVSTKTISNKSLEDSVPTKTISNKRLKVQSKNMHIAPPSTIPLPVTATAAAAGGANNINWRRPPDWWSLQRSRRKTETKKRQQKKRIDKLNQKRGTTLEFTEGTSKSRRPTRAAAAKSRAAITELAEKEGIESTISEITDTQAVKWDKYLSIYKEYVGNICSDIVFQEKPVLKEGDRSIADPISFLVPAVEWNEEFLQNSARSPNAAYTILRTRMGNNMKNTLNEIIKIINGHVPPLPCPLPPYPELMISTDNWKKFQNFSEALLDGWKRFIGVPYGVGSIYTNDNRYNLKYKDTHMWDDTKRHYKNPVKAGDAAANIITSDPRANKSGFRPRLLSDFHFDAPIINNSAILSKYDRFKHVNWICPIPSIIDAQSVCNNLPIMKHDEREDGGPDRVPYYPDPFDVTVTDPTTTDKIIININKDVHGPPFNYLLKFTFTGSGRGGLNIEKEINLDYMKNKNILSAYNITEEFIKQKCIDGDGNLKQLNTVGQSGLSDLHDIMGIFALKLMGDFSQELYAISRGTYFFANDRVSVARYLLLKVHGRRTAAPARQTLLTERGGGGYLSYGGKRNNYFLITGEPAPVPATTGGGKKKKKVKKTKRKSRKKVKKTKRKSRKSRKKRK